MKTTFLSLPILCGFLGFFSLGSCTSKERPENLEKKKYSVSDFKKIDLSGFYDVNIVKGDQFSVEIVATPDDHKLLSVNSVDGTLDVRYLKSNTQKYAMEVKIVMPDLSGFAIAGASEATEISGFNGKSLFVSIEGSADVSLQNCYYSSLELELSGEGSVNTLKSTAQNASAILNGTGTIQVHAKESLNAEVNGMGKIKYSGAPKLISSINGQGSITHI